MTMSAKEAKQLADAQWYALDCKEELASCRKQVDNLLAMLKTVTARLED